MKNKLVSIILPCYNVARYLDNVLQSITDQTYTNWECIIIDDGSSDNIKLIVDPWIKKEPRFKYFYQDNKGLSGARNTGLKQASGDFIYFLDPDDLISSDTLSNLTSLIQPDNDFAIGLTATTEGQNKNIKDLLFHKPKPLISHSNANKNLLNLVIEQPLSSIACNKLYRFSFLKKNNLWFKDRIYHEDELWFFQTLYHANSIILNDKATYFYNVVNTGSITNNFTLKNLESYLTIIQEIYANYYKKDISNKNAIATYITYLQQMVINYAYSKLSKTDKVEASSMISSLFTDINFIDFKPTIRGKQGKTYLEFQSISHLKPEKVKRFLKYSRSNKVSRKIKKKLFLLKFRRKTNINQH